MERLELVEQGLSKLRGQPWLTVGKCSAACELNRPTQHKPCGPRRSVDAVHASDPLQTVAGLLVDILFVTSPDHFSVREC